MFVYGANDVWSLGISAITQSYRVVVCTEVNNPSIAIAASKENADNPGGGGGLEYKKGRGARRLA